MVQEKSLKLNKGYIIALLLTEESFVFGLLHYQDYRKQAGLFLFSV
jgi:hypothetical protein